MFMDKKKAVKMTMGYAAAMLMLFGTVMPSSAASNYKTDDNKNAWYSVYRLAVQDKKDFNDEKIKVKKDELEAAIKKARELNKEDYTAESWKRLEEALKEAEKVMANAKATQKTVDNAKDKLNRAIRELKAKKEVKKDELENLIRKAKELNEEDYTKESWSTLKEALAKAEKVMSKADATQEMVDKAAEKLNKAISELKEKEEIKKEELEAAIKKARELNENDYTPESWKQLKEALAEAEKVMADENATQEMVDEAAAGLNGAIDALEEIDENHDEQTEIYKELLEVFKKLQQTFDRLLNIFDRIFG